MTHKTHQQRAYDSSLQLMQQAQANERNMQQCQAIQQRLQGKVQACQKHLQESYQRNLNYGPIGFTKTSDGFDYRFGVWCVIQSMGSVVIVIGTPLTLSLRVATKVVLPLLGFFSVTSAIGCYYYNRLPAPSLEGIDMIIMPEIEGESKKLAAEGYSSAIRSLFSKVACYCSSWFISQGKSASKLHL